MMTREQQMSCGRPETLCYSSEERDSLELVSKQILRSCSKRFAKPYVSRMEDSQYWKGMVSSISCRVQNVTEWGEKTIHHWIVCTLIMIIMKFDLKIIFQIFLLLHLKTRQEFGHPSYVSSYKKNTFTTYF
jgi:hypothetical protein